IRAIVCARPASSWRPATARADPAPRPRSGHAPRDPPGGPTARAVRPIPAPGVPPRPAAPPNPVPTTGRPGDSPGRPPGTGAGPILPRSALALPSTPAGGRPFAPDPRSGRWPPSRPPIGPGASPPGRRGRSPHRCGRHGATGRSSLRDPYEADCIRIRESCRRPCSGSSSAARTSRTGQGLATAPPLLESLPSLLVFECAILKEPLLIPLELLPEVAIGLPPKSHLADPPRTCP